MAEKLINIPIEDQVKSLEKVGSLSRDIVKEFENLSKLSYDELHNIIGVYEQYKKTILLLYKKGELDKKTFRLKEKDVIATENIYKSQLKLGYVENKRFEILWKTRELLQDYVKEQEKILKLQDILKKMGLGWLVNAAELVKLYGKQGALILITLGGVVLLVRTLFRDFRAIDGAAAEFRKTIGILRKDSERLEKIARNITFNYAHLGVTAQDVYKSMLAITATIGSSQGITEDMVRDMTLLSVQLGVAESTSADFLRVMGQIAKDTMSSQTNMLLFTAALSAAAGTNLNEVMGDVAAASKSGYQFLSRDPVALAKAAVEARKMGTSLESATKTSSSLLNFTQSVKDEMEASVLVGKSINLQKARELAYHRDIRGLNAEILNIMKQTDFENLDPFQQDAVAKALGKSADELAKMAQADREMNAMKRSSDPLVKAQVAEYERLMNINKSMVGTEADKQRQQATALANAEALKTISLAWHAILQRLLQGPWTSILWVLGKIAGGLMWINNLTKSWGFLSVAAASWIDDLIVLVLGLGAVMWGPKVFGRLLGGKAEKLFGGLGKGIGNFVKNIMTKLKGVGSFIESISKSIGKSITNIAKGIGSGIKAIFKGLADGLGYLSKPNLLIGVLVLAALGASLIPFAYSMKLLTGISWKTFGIAAASLGLLVLAAAALGALMMSGVGAAALLLGAAAIAVLGASLIPFAYSMKLLTGISWKTFGIAAASLGLLVLAAAALGALMMSGVGAAALLLGAAAIAVLGASLIPAAVAMKMAGAGFKSLGDGLKETVDSLVELKQLSFLSTIKEIFMLTASIAGLSKAIASMPKVDITPLSKYADVAVDINKPMGKGEKQKPTATNDDIVSAITKGFDDLRNDFKNGTITANVFLDSQKLDAGMGRRLTYTGALT